MYIRFGTFIVHFQNVKGTSQILLATICLVPKYKFSGNGGNLFSVIIIIYVLIFADLLIVNLAISTLIRFFTNYNCVWLFDSDVGKKYPRYVISVITRVVKYSCHFRNTTIYIRGIEKIAASDP